MDDPRQNQPGAGDAQSEAIKEVCEKAVNEPVELWNELASKGIEATPGAVYQALNELSHSEPKTDAPPGRKYWKGEVPGLTAEDVEAVGALASKVGGLDRLISILTVMQGLTE